MALPGITSVTILDGSLGIIPDDATSVCVKLGACSLGTANQIYSFNSVQDVKDTLGTGKLVDALAVSLDIAGGPVYAIKMDTSVAGTTSPIQKNLVTTPTASDGNMTVSGSPLDDYNVIVNIVRAGKVGTAPYPTIQYSLDGGQSYSEEIAVPISGVYVVPSTGLTLTFTNSTNGFFIGDSFKFTTVAATWNNTNLSTALTALLADTGRNYGFIHIIGVADSTIATTVASYMNAAQTNEKYIHADIEARDMDFIAKLETAAQTFPMTFAGGETLNIQVSTDGGATFPVTKTFTFPAVAYAAIGNLVTALNVQSFTGGLFSVYASTTPATGLTLATLSNKGRVQLKVAASTGIGGALIQYTLGQTAKGEEEDTWMNSLIADFIGFSSTRVSVFGGYADIYTSASKRYVRRSGAWLQSAREALVPISEDLGKVARGPLPNILTPNLPLGIYGIYHDEDAKPGLDVARFSTLRRFRGLPGFYITNARNMASPGSDYTFMQFRRVIDRVTELLNIISKQYINSEVRINSDGTIYEEDAVAIENRVFNYIFSAVKDNISGLQVQVDRTVNIQSTMQLKIKVSVRPFGYFKFISLTTGFAPVQPVV